MKILVATEMRSGVMESHSFELLGAARQIATDGDEIIAFFAGVDVDAAKTQLGAADKLIAAIDSTLEMPLSETYGRLLDQVIAAESPDLVLAAYSANGLDVAAGAAVRNELALLTYVVGLERKGKDLLAQSQLYGGKFLASCVVTGPSVLLVNPGVFDEAPASAINDVTEISAKEAIGATRAELVSVEMPDLSEIDISSAEKIVCVGRSIGDEGSIELAREFADLLGAELAGSRPVVDNGWLDKMRQVGKSGQKVKPKLYLALGVSGAPEHVEGMSGSDLIVAINTDASAPIFNLAHFGADGDLFDFMASMTDLLQARVKS